MNKLLMTPRAVETSEIISATDDCEISIISLRGAEGIRAVGNPKLGHHVSCRRSARGRAYESWGEEGDLSPGISEEAHGPESVQTRQGNRGSQVPRGSLCLVWENSAEST